VEKTRQFLGGDATHSVLVKGLDYSLLAQRKAELEREREVGRDEELEAMMDDIPTKAGPSVPKTKMTETEAEELGKGVSVLLLLMMYS
jgi:IK cytokine